MHLWSAVAWGRIPCFRSVLVSQIRFWIYGPTDPYRADPDPQPAVEWFKEKSIYQSLSKYGIYFEDVLKGHSHKIACEIIALNYSLDQK
jgi:hypothetical protein